MKMKHKISIIVTLITSIGGIICAIIAAGSYGELNTQNEYIKSNVISINGDGNEIVINNVDDLVAAYNTLLSEHELLKEQNAQYFMDYTEQKGINEELISQLSEAPIIEYKSLSLCKEAVDIPIDSNNSMITIDGRDYMSREIFEKVVSDNQNVTIKNNTIYIGKVISESASLFSQKVFDYNTCQMSQTFTDSYGNTYADGVCFHYYTGYIIYNLGRKFSYLDLTIAISEDASLDKKGILTIKADEKVVYTSNNLDKKTEPYSVKQIPINNCSLLTIEYNTDTDYNDCIISKAIVYN